MNTERETFSMFLEKLEKREQARHELERQKAEREAIERPMRLRAEQLRKTKIGTAEDASFLINYYTNLDSYSWMDYTSGLVSGCFDVVHIGQLEFLKQAKYRVDGLYVAVDPDETVSLKGPGRPVNRLEDRLQMLAGLDVVTFTFPLPFVLKNYKDTPGNRSLFERLTRDINPDYIVTNEVTDPFWQEKMERAQKLGIGYMGLHVERPTSSTELIEKIQRL